MCKNEFNETGYELYFVYKEKNYTCVFIHLDDKLSVLHVCFPFLSVQPWYLAMSARVLGNPEKYTQNELLVSYILNYFFVTNRQCKLLKGAATFVESRMFI